MSALRQPLRMRRATLSFQLPHRLTRGWSGLGASVRTWWCGEDSLLRSIGIGTSVLVAGLCLWVLLVGGGNEYLYTQQWVRRRTVWLLFTTGLMWAAAAPIFRHCLHRLSQPRSVLLTFAVFMACGYALLCGLAQQVEVALDVVQTLRQDESAGWQPLRVYADPALGRIVANGDITPYSAEVFEAVLAANPQYPVVQFESFGGYVTDALRMAAVVRDRQLSVVSLRVCMSACTLVFIAGQQRYLGPQVDFGFHRSGYPGMSADEPLRPADEQIAQRYRSAGVSEAFIAQALATPHAQMWEPSQSELFESHFATLRWSERPANW